MNASKRVPSVVLALAGLVLLRPPALSTGRAEPFRIEEATIEGIQSAILRKELTSTRVVELYLARIKAYNGTCVSQPKGILGPVSTIKHAGKINSLMTLNLRPAHRAEWGFDDRKARSMTDKLDADPRMPDALEVAAQQDAYFARTGKLIGPLHGVVLAIKDQYDTYDMRTTAGADAFYANDRPPRDGTFVKRLREAGAIVIGKANMGEYATGGVAGTRSSFGGVNCSAYDTERDPGASSGGSGNSVGANLVTCAIGEETGTSVREPAKNASAVGLAPTRELVSADGMIQRGIRTRVGPICRTVQDVARILDVYAGYDPNDELTAFSVGRKPAEPYASFAKPGRLEGVRIGVVREYMDRDLFTVADSESISIVEKAIDDLRALGATIVDPGPHGALFQKAVDKYTPTWRNALFIGQNKEVFPDSTNHFPTLIDMYADPSLVPHKKNQPSIRNLGGGANDVGGSRYNLETYLHDRGDANIRTVADLVAKSNFWEDSLFQNRKRSLLGTDSARTFATGADLQDRFAIQTIVMATFAEQNLDAVIYPTGNIPSGILTNPDEPTKNDRNAGPWTYVNSKGFPAMTVPAGFTTQVYDRLRDLSQPDSTRLVGPSPAKLPVGIDFLGRPFTEPLLLRIAAAYEARTRHRLPPPDFGPLPERPTSDR